MPPGPRLGVTLLSRLLRSSDGAVLRELHWIGAREGRHALTETVTDEELTVGQAEDLAGLKLAGNARRLYRIYE